MNNLIIFRFTV